MGEIQEVFDDLKDSLGNKGFYILIGGAVLFGLYNLVKGSRNSDGLTTVTAITSYPDASTNANVIIDTLQRSIDYTENVLSDQISGLDDKIDINFEATNNYINSGFESQNKLLGENMDEIHGKLEGITENYKELSSTIDKNYASLSGSHASIQNAMNQMKNDLSGIQSSVNSSNSAIDDLKNKVNTMATTKPATTTTANNEYYKYSYRMDSVYNTQQSIVDALKVIGVNSSDAYRAKIAVANGIVSKESDYRGTYDQNVAMLESLKAGTLKKV